MAKFVLYRYDPSLPAAAVFVALFGITTAFHMYQAVRKRALFMIPFIVGGLFEVIGYIGRALSHSDNQKLSYYIMQTLLILLAPALFAASIYMILGRIIRLVDGEKYSLIRASWLTKIFVCGDVLAFLTQCLGGGIISSGKKTPSKVTLGQDIILAGLFLQVIFFGFFVVVAVVFHKRALPHRRHLSSTVPWLRHLNVLYVTSGLILIRSVFRIIEYIQGNDGFILSHEVFLYVFDGLLMLIVMVIMNLAHPGDIAGMLKKKQTEGVPLNSNDSEQGSGYEQYVGHPRK